MTPQLIYWITRLDGIKALSITAAVLCAAGIVALVIWRSFMAIDIKYPSQAGYEQAKVFIPKVTMAIFVLPVVFSIMITVSVLIPTTKEMAIIYVLPEIANNETIQELPEDFKTIKDMAMDKIKEMLD